MFKVTTIQQPIIDTKSINLLAAYCLLCTIDGQCLDIFPRPIPYLRSSVGTVPCACPSLAHRRYGMDERKLVSEQEGSHQLCTQYHLECLCTWLTCQKMRHLR